MFLLLLEVFLPSTSLPVVSFTSPFLLLGYFMSSLLLVGSLNTPIDGFTLLSLWPLIGSIRVSLAIHGFSSCRSYYPWVYFMFPLSLVGSRQVSLPLVGCGFASWFPKYW
jgi:hypothetical protein